MTAATATETAVRGSSLGDVYHLLFRHKRKIIAGAVLGIVGAVLVFLLTAPVFRSEARLLVRYVTDTTVLDPTAPGGRVIATADGSSALNSEVEILSSRDLIERLVDELGPQQFVRKGAGQPARPLAILNVLRNLQIDVPKRSNVIRVYYDGPTPEIAQKLLSRLVDGYLQKHIDIHRSAQAYEFLSQQTDEIRARLMETDAELKKLKEDAGVVSIEESKRAFAVRVQELNRDLQEAETALAASRAQIEFVQAQWPVSEGTAATNAASEASAAAVSVRALYDRLEKLQTREFELLAVYTEDSPVVRSVRKRIDEAKQLLAAYGQSPERLDLLMPATNATLSLIAEQSLVAAMGARSASLKEHLERTQSEAKRLDEIDGRVQELERNKDILEAKYRNYSQGLEQARIDDALDSRKISNIGIVQPASFPTMRMRPNLPRNILLVLAIGLLGGLGLAVLTEYFLDQSFRRPEEAEAALRVPVLLSIPDFGGGAPKQLAARTGAAPRALLPASGEPAAPVPPGDARNPELAAYFEALADRMISAAGSAATRPLVFGVTSCAHGSGVTTIATGLALAFANRDHGRVVLVDAGPSRDPAHSVFGVKSSQGLSDIVPDGAGETAIIERKVYRLSDAAPASRVSASASLDDLLQTARKTECDIVVLDLPPVSDTSPVLRIAGRLDGMLMVIEAERGARETAARAKELLDRADAKLVGTVLNKRHTYVPTWLYPTV